MSKAKVTDINSGSATAGQVPTADGSGGVAWGDQSGGGGGGGGNLVLIAEFTATGSETSHTFSGIPGTYRDLIFVGNVRSSVSAGSANIDVTMNSDTGANYDRQRVGGFNTTVNGSEAFAQTSLVIGTVAGDTSPTGSTGSFEGVVFEYSGTTFHKSAFIEYLYKTANATNSLFNQSMKGVWRSTSAVTSLTFNLSSGNFMAGSTIRLYGRKADASVGAEPYPIKVPNSSLFTLTNLGTGVGLSSNDGSHCFTVKRTDSGTGSAERVGFMGKAVPAGSSWEAILGFWTTPFGRASGRHLRSGLSILENSTGKSLNVLFNTQNQAPELCIHYYSNLNTYGSTPVAIGAVFGGRQLLYFKIGYDGTNYTFYYSMSMTDEWILLATLAKASYFTADRVGVVLESFGTYFVQDHRMDVVYYDDPDF